MSHHGVGSAATSLASIHGPANERPGRKSTGNQAALVYSSVLATRILWCIMDGVNHADSIKGRTCLLWLNEMDELQVCKLVQHAKCKVIGWEQAAYRGTPLCAGRRSSGR